MTRERMELLARVWRRRITAREVLFVAAAGCAAVAGAAFWLPLTIVLPAAFALAAVTLMARLAQLQPWKLGAPHVARHLDRAFPELEESSELWLRPPAALTFVERLQRRRVDEVAEHLDPSLGAPARDFLRAAWICFAAGVVLLAAALMWSMARGGPRGAWPVEQTSATGDETTQTPPPATVSPKIERAELAVAPPAYTGRPERVVSGLNAEIEEGSAVAWSITMDREVQELRVRFGSRDDDALLLRSDDNRTFRAEHTIRETSLYSVRAPLPDQTVWAPTELYSIKVIKDRAPVVKILQPAAPRTEIAPPSAPEAPAPTVAVEVLISDDYAIKDAHLIATVAKGTGEAVKFREQTFPFDGREPVAQEPNARRFVKTFDLRALGLEPGDELYFHVEAADNREPTSNRARSETRFIVLKGTDQSVSSPGAGVAGLNLVPQYFRSQRQIIIDTEKLIVDQPTLPAAEFRDRANNLAIDQQLLRQRYGQFLGEEAETHEEHSPDDGHDHGAEMPAPPPRNQDQIAAQFGHQHDSQDTATLFDREVKGTMRQALAAMWEAERFLRVANPGEALVPENRALQILKELQQADRAYVQRVGFEAAPINFAERRLRGDVTDVPVTASLPAPAPQPDAAEEAIRMALRAAPWQQAEPTSWAALREIEPALTAAATREPEAFMAGLQALRGLLTGEAAQRESRLDLERALLRILPAAKPQPARSREVSPSLAKPYFDSLGRVEATEPAG
jgi:hypothetical protein